MRFKQYLIEGQTIPSADTSRPQVAAALKKIPWESGTVNLDLGGGKYDIGTEYLKHHGVTNLVYDPFNRTSEHNKEVLSFVKVTPPATVTVNNVLNVIKEPEHRDDLIKLAAKYAQRGGGVAYFSIHIDPKKTAGVSKVDKEGNPVSWQNHMPLKAYADEIQKHFSNVKIWKDIIIAKI